MAAQEGHAGAAHAPDAELVRRISEGRLDLDPASVLEAFLHLVEPAAPDHPDDAVIGGRP
jgi:hypothetical protein